MYNPAPNAKSSDNPYEPYTQNHQNWETQRQINNRNKMDWSNQTSTYSAPASNPTYSSKKTSAQTRSNSKNTGSQISNADPESAVRAIFGIAGFLFIAIPIYRWDDEKWILAVILGLIAGAVAAKYFKGIIIVGLIIAALYFFSIQ